ncbi:hypothetical protein BDR07DRAFT_1374345 [Suillus spraguei]|nr:hypothetical protein BDR07DRAFT_1374345 [Suillus spraguei]
MLLTLVDESPTEPSFSKNTLLCVRYRRLVVYPALMTHELSCCLKSVQVYTNCGLSLPCRGRCQKKYIKRFSILTLFETNAHFYVRPNATGDRYDDPRRWFIPSFFSPWLVWQALLVALANSTKEREGPLNTSGGGHISKPPGLLQLIAQRRVSGSSVQIEFAPALGENEQTIDGSLDAVWINKALFFVCCGLLYHSTAVGVSWPSLAYSWQRRGRIYLVDGLATTGLKWMTMWKVPRLNERSTLENLGIR